MVSAPVCSCHGLPGFVTRVSDGGCISAGAACDITYCTIAHMAISVITDGEFIYSFPQGLGNIYLTLWRNLYLTYRYIWLYTHTHLRIAMCIGVGTQLLYTCIHSYIRGREGSMLICVCVLREHIVCLHSVYSRKGPITARLYDALAKVTT